MLIEGFKLQEHLQSLRCYHFMELADWADLFIMSLRNCVCYIFSYLSSLSIGISYWFFKSNQKWHVNEVDKRIPEIQGILEQAVRRSSCEKDPNKNRLYVYLKGDGVRCLSASAIGTLYNSLLILYIWKANSPCINLCFNKLFDFHVVFLSLDYNLTFGRRSLLWLFRTGVPNWLASQHSSDSCCIEIILRYI